MLGPIGFLILLLSGGAPAPPAEVRIQCDIGPIERTFAGHPWKVFSCSDGRSLAVVSPDSNPKVQFFFWVLVRDGQENAVGGHGTGDGTIIAATNLELRRLTPNQIAALISATKAR